MTSTNKSSSEKQRFLVGAAQQRLINFCQVTDARYIANWHHEIIAEHLQNAYENIQQDKKTRIILELPPRHGKSELATKKFPAWSLGKDPTLPFIVVSYAADLAETFGQGTRDIIASPEYRAIFPKTTLRKDTKAKGNWMTTKGGNYLAVGVGGPITGKGAKIAVIDDPFKNREEAESATYRQKVWDWYTSTLYTRLEGYGAIIVIMTRWHVDDLVGRLKEQTKENIAAGEPYDDWTIIKFPAVAIDDETYRKEGEALWEYRFPLPVLENIKKNSYYDWASLYQQDPILSESQEFKSEYFKSWKEEDLRRVKLLRYTTTVDPAISQKATADNSVILTVGKEVGGPNWYRAREDAGRFTPKQLIDIVFSHQSQYNSDVGIETIAFQKALQYIMEEEQRKREQYFIIREIRSHTAKEVRIRGLLPLYENGVIWHRPTDTAYEEEALQFPRGKRDDRLDAMAMQLELVRNTATNRFVRSKIKPFTGYFRKR